MREVLRYLRLVWRLRLGTTAARFGRFGLVGISGLAVNSLALVAFRTGFGFSVLAAALLATQVSSVWNFLLTERFVFRGTSPSRSFGGRAFAFLVMNNLAFLLRGPLLLGLMSAFGLHYVLANLISLCALTVIRFALADRWIWATAHPVRALYDIHSLATVDSDVVLPELARFRVPALAAPPSIRVTVESLGRIAGSGAARAEDGTGSSPTAKGAERLAVRIEMGESVAIAVSRSFAARPTSSTPTAPSRCCAGTWPSTARAVHAACAASTIALPGHGAHDTGKTTTILRLLDSFPQAEFVSTTSRSWHPTAPSPRTRSRSRSASTRCMRCTRPT
jgi:putative flippase GtrA